MKAKISTAILSIFAAWLFSAASSAQNLPDVKLKVIGPQSRGVAWHLIVKPFWDEELPKLSNGAIQPDLASITELGLSGSEVFRLLKMGVADLGIIVMGYASGEVPELDGFDLAGAVPNVEALGAVTTAYGPVVNDIMLKRVGLRVLGYFPLGQQGLWCSTPISGIGDLKGKKVRVFATTQADFVVALGGSPVTMPATEVPASLQRKVIDCAVTGLLSGNIGKWPEVTSHLYPINFGWAMMTVVINQKSWDRLGKNVQDFLTDKIQNVMIARAWDLARESDDQGIWCSTGDSRCSWGSKESVTRYNIKLVPYTDSDDAIRKRALEEAALPEFAKRCGAECTSAWNTAAGKALGVQAKAKK
ncbi:TRAP transporter substrate-binding protein [Shumkonia mesophila]|uniref:TRAP transporter substrate-binding protein n=1 Tax=Shumkonia mesophila TaxID=2838854 RepID=UPI00293458B2|nr:TRAP transporter substrate-binding protein [Shumkonia mesophila]